MSIPVLVRSVGPEPSAGYYTQWTTFVPGYPKFKNQDTGVTSALYNGAAIEANLVSYRAHYLYFTGKAGEIVDRTVDFDVGSIPAAGQYYDIPVKAYDPGSTGFNPDAGSSRGTAQLSGPSALDVVVTESFAVSTGDTRVTPWLHPRTVRQLGSGIHKWVNFGGAKLRDDGVSASKLMETTDGYQLIGQDFGASLPSGARIDGVEVEVLRRGSDAAAAERVDVVVAYAESGGEAWGLEAAAATGVSLTGLLPGGTVDMSAFCFSSDGTRLYVTSRNGLNYFIIFQFNLSTAWDLSSATDSGLSKQITTGIGFRPNSPVGLAISGNGETIYIGDNSPREIFQLHLGTPWNVATASLQPGPLALTGTRDPEGIVFNPSGTKLYVFNGTVYQYTLATPWDVTTATDDGVSVTLANGGKDLFISADGMKMFALVDTNPDIMMFNLASPWDIASASNSGVTFDLFLANLRLGLVFSEDGTKFYAGVRVSSTYQIQEYTAGTPLVRELVKGQVLDEGYTLNEGSVYATIYGELFSGAGVPQIASAPRVLAAGGGDETGGLDLKPDDVNNISFGVSYTARGEGALAVDEMRLRIHYRADLSNDSIPAKRSNGLSGVAESPSGVKVAVGVDGKILRKPANSPTWDAIASGTTISLNAVEWVGDRFIAVGVGGIALDGGVNGSAWTRIDTGAVSSLWAIRRVPDTLRAIAVGNDDYAFERSRLGVWSA
jgi:hypothetical protein